MSLVFNPSLMIDNYSLNYIIQCESTHAIFGYIFGMFGFFLAYISLYKFPERILYHKQKRNIAILVGVSLAFLSHNLIDFVWGWA